MTGIIRWVRAGLSFCFFVLLLFSAFNHDMVIYLLRQAAGQARIVLHTSTFEEFSNKNLTKRERDNLMMVQHIREYSVNELGFKQTGNYTRIFDQQGRPTLWTISASERFSLTAYEWKFPMLGVVTYKGFFDPRLAIEEAYRLHSLGYDTEIRPVTAWSTLGWFNDPVMSNTLNRTKGSLCNLIFHELFHATFYAKGQTDLNENLANFVADKATILFLSGDSISLQQYLRIQHDQQICRNFTARAYRQLQTFYDTVKERNDNERDRIFTTLADSAGKLAVSNPKKLTIYGKELIKFKNAYFVGFRQYESLHDSLEKVFNKFYRGDLKKMVQDLKLN